MRRHCTRNCPHLQSVDCWDLRSLQVSCTRNNTREESRRCRCSNFRCFPNCRCWNSRSRRSRRFRSSLIRLRICHQYTSHRRCTRYPMCNPIQRALGKPSNPSCKMIEWRGPIQKQRRVHLRKEERGDFSCPQRTERRESLSRKLAFGPRRF
jgi:hypothetical protein